MKHDSGREAGRRAGKGSHRSTAAIHQHEPMLLNVESKRHNKFQATTGAQFCSRNSTAAIHQYELTLFNVVSKRLKKFQATTGAQVLQAEL